MKKILVILITICLITASLIAAIKTNLKGQKIKEFPYYIYTDASNEANHCFTSFKGDFWNLQIDDNYNKDCLTAKTCIQIKYNVNGKAKKNSSAQISLSTNPSNSWTSKQGGDNLTTAKTLCFFAKGEKGGEMAEFKMQSLDYKEADEKGLSLGTVKLSDSWKLYTIDISNAKLSDIAGGFSVNFLNVLNSSGCTIYIDNIYYTDKELPYNITK